MLRLLPQPSHKQTYILWTATWEDNRLVNMWQPAVTFTCCLLLDRRTNKRTGARGGGEGETEMNKPAKTHTTRRLQQKRTNNKKGQRGGGKVRLIRKKNQQGLMCFTGLPGDSHWLSWRLMKSSEGRGDRGWNAAPQQSILWVRRLWEWRFENLFRQQERWKLNVILLLVMVEKCPNLLFDQPWTNSLTAGSHSNVNNIVSAALSSMTLHLAAAWLHSVTS